MIVYVAVPCDYFLYNPFPRGTSHGDEAMRVIWGIPDVVFIRNNHPKGDLYKVTIPGNEFTEADRLVLTLKLSGGTIVTDIQQ